MAEKASWVTAKPEKIKEKIIELAKQGMSAEKIGLVLRDQEGIPKARLLGLKISKVLKEADLWEDPRSNALKRKVEILVKHFSNNKHDYSAQRSLVKRNSEIRRIV